MNDLLPSMLKARHWYALFTATVTAVLVACGGGGDGVDTGGTGSPASFASGRISGFGSVIVNGTHFDESMALVRDDDGGMHLPSDLKLGMTVDIDAGAITVDANGVPRGQAMQIEIASHIKGPVQSVDAAAGTLVVLGQPVTVDADTVFSSNLNGLAALQANDMVEVFAFLDPATGVYAAARIEKEDGLSAYKLRGVVSDLDVNASTFMIGGIKVEYGGIPAAQRPVLSNGLVVRVSLQTTPHAGAWVATKLSAGMRHAPDHARSEIEGFITDFVSAASFKVNGMPVNASGNVNFQGGTAAQLANGVRVEVDGTVTNGVLVATKLEFEPMGHGGGHGHGNMEIELDGAITSVAADLQSFVLRGVTVRIDGNTRFDGGSATSLAANAAVEVKGNLIAGTSEVLATRIKFRGH